MADFAEENVAVEESSEKKKKGLPIIPIVIILVLIIAIGAVGWFVVLPMLSGGGEEPETEAEALMEGEESSELAVYDPENQPGILEFPDSFTIKLRKRQGVLETETYLQFALSLEVASPEIQTAMEGDSVVMARIQDKINTFFASKYTTNVEVHNWPLLKDQLINELNAEFPEEYYILRVNFHDFLLQPGR